MSDCFWGTREEEVASNDWRCDWLSADIYDALSDRGEAVRRCFLAVLPRNLYDFAIAEHEPESFKVSGIKPSWHRIEGNMYS
jgi:hypothetical protein